MQFNNRFKIRMSFLQYKNTPPPPSPSSSSSSSSSSCMSYPFTVAAANATNQSILFTSESPTIPLRKKIRVISCSDDYLVINKPANLRMNNKKENDGDKTDASSVEEQSSAWLSNYTFKGSNQQNPIAFLR